MAVGQKLRKWTWMMDNVEVRGMVRREGVTDGTEMGTRDSFNLELAPNYRHIVTSMRGNQPPPPDGGPPGRIHVEAYSHGFDDPEAISPVEPFPLPDKPDDQKFEVRIDRAGSRRPLRAGDHVRLFGRWIIENQHEDLCWTRKWGPSNPFNPADKLYQVGCVWAELHPFHWQSIELVEALDPERNVETLSLAAPVYEETFRRGGPLVGIAGHVFVADDRSNYHHTMTADAHIKSPSPPEGSKPGDYKVVHREEVLINGTGLPVSQVRTDLMARLAGLGLRDRFGGWRREPFGASSPNHVSVYAAA